MLLVNSNGKMRENNWSNGKTQHLFTTNLGGNLLVVNKKSDMIGVFI